MKRIIARISLVALIATTVAPMAQGNWVKYGFRLFGQSVQYNSGTFMPCIAGVAAGVGALAYERVCKAKVAAAQAEQKKKDQKYETMQEEIARLKEMVSHLPHGLNDDFAKLAQADQEAIQQEFQAMAKSRGDETQAKEKAASELRAKITAQIAAKEEACKKEFPHGKPTEYSSLRNKLDIAKFAGFIGGAFLAPELLYRLAQAYVYHGAFKNDNYHYRSTCA